MKYLKFGKLGWDVSVLGFGAMRLPVLETDPIFMAGKQADQCEECYECETVCPQGLPIVEWLKTCHKAFTG